MASPQLAAGTPRRNLEATRLAVTAAEREAEKERQVTLRTKNLEIQQLGNKQDDHRRQLDHAIVAKNQLLDDVRSVRDHMHGKLRVAKAKGMYDIGVSDRALARAGQVALSARTEADKWQARSELEEAHARAVCRRNEEALSRMQEGAAARVTEMQKHNDQRVDHGVRITEEHANNHEQICQRHIERFESHERSAQHSAFQKMTSAEQVRREADLKVRAEMDKAARGQVKAVHELAKSRQEAETTVMEAKRKLEEKRWESDATIATENVCHAQAKNIAAAMKEAHEFQCQIDLQRLEDKLARMESHLEQRVDVASAELPVAKKRNEEWIAKMGRDVEAANARADDEHLDAIQRVNAAKVTLGNLQAQFAAYIADLLKQWEDAKRENAAKVAAASKRTEEIEQFCRAHHKKCEKKLDDMIKQTEHFADTKKAYLEDRCSSIDELAKNRVDMMQQQSRERRKQAEQRLAHLEQHIKDVKFRCDQRVRAEAATAEERVRIAQERFREHVDRQNMRADEAVRAREEAHQAYAAVAARCQGAAKEARRRGLENIAQMLVPPLIDDRTRRSTVRKSQAAALVAKASAEAAGWGTAAEAGGKPPTAEAERAGLLTGSTGLHDGMDTLSSLGASTRPVTSQLPQVAVASA
mmetsp:Transcript_114895/g.336106  ORF Transcript_114895/g.336106 Transcript_114895/m.336106 type:complete len:642 (-) Transcript_114895:42-1967(-)